MMSPMLREFVALATAETALTYDGFLQAHALSAMSVRAEILRQMEEVYDFGFAGVGGAGVPAWRRELAHGQRRNIIGTRCGIRSG